VIGFCTVGQGFEVAEKVMLVQRDHGNRTECVWFYITPHDHALTLPTIYTLLVAR
jgi:hypothetical protein